MAHDTEDLSREMAERSYRRGFHQSLAAAAQVIAMARDLDHAKELMARAERIANDYRAEHPPKERSMIHDLVADVARAEHPSSRNRKARKP